jgi:hypothetical protein
MRLSKKDKAIIGVIMMGTTLSIAFVVGVLLRIAQSLFQ